MNLHSIIFKLVWTAIPLSVNIINYLHSIIFKLVSKECENHWQLCFHLHSIIFKLVYVGKTSMKIGYLINLICLFIKIFYYIAYYFFNTLLKHLFYSKFSSCRNYYIFALLQIDRYLYSKMLLLLSLLTN